MLQPNLYILDSPNKSHEVMNHGCSSRQKGAIQSLETTIEWNPTIALHNSLRWLAFQFQDHNLCKTRHWRETGVKHCNLIEHESICCLENESKSGKADALLMARVWSETGTLSGVVFLPWKVKVKKHKKNFSDSGKAQTLSLARDWSETGTLSGVVFETPILWLVSVRFYLSVWGAVMF